MKKTIITISREFGSGGHAIGEKLAEKLGYEFYDHDLITKVAQENLLPENFVAANEENAGRGHIFRGLIPGLIDDADARDLALFKAQEKFIRQAAEKGNCVIVGRCADYYLKDDPSCLKVFIYADLPYRIRRITKLQNLKDPEAEELIHETDKKRSNHYQYVTKHAWSDKGNYDLMLDSSTLGIEACVDILVKLAQG